MITLADAIGNVETRAILSALLKKPDTESRPPVHIYGNPRTGKTTLGKAYVYAYGCNDRTLCGECAGCKMPKNSHLTVRVFHGASMTELEAKQLETMGALLLHQKALGAVLIDDAHLLEENVALALAHSIDESGSRVAYCLTSSFRRMHPALESRVLPVKTRNMTRTEALAWLESVEYPGDPEKIYRVSGGNIGRLIGAVAVASLSGSTDSLPDPRHAAILTIRALQQSNMAGGMAALLEYLNYGGTYEEWTEALRAEILEILRARVGAIGLPEHLKEFTGVTEPMCITILKVLRDEKVADTTADTLDKAHITFAFLLDAVAPNLYAPANVTDSQSQEDWDGDLSSLVSLLPEDTTEQ